MIRGKDADCNQGKIRADLHVHTYYSDGYHSPEDMVLEAKRNGVNLLAITDHDNCVAAQESENLKGYGVKVLVGEEVSAYYGCVKVHVLGYGMDLDCAAFRRFNAELLKGAEERAYDILDKLAYVGVKLDISEVEKYRKSPDAPLHSMYIARAAAEKLYGESPFGFYTRFLSYGKAGFSLVGRPSPEETCKVIAESGGVSSLAHPGRITLNKTDLADLVSRLKACGLNGIEAVYSGHTKEQTQYYKEMAESYGLLVTGGSDCHSLLRGSKSVGSPAFYPDEQLLSALKTV